MMALHGLAFARHQDEWRIVMCEDEDPTPAIQNALAEWMKRSDKTPSR